MNSISFNTNFTRLLLFKVALVVSISTAVAGGSSVGLNRFTEVDTSSANNDNGGFYNASNHPNAFAFATLQADGSIKAWGHSSYGGTGEPAGSGYTKIYSNGYAFAATKTDGSITAWGASYAGGTSAPSGSGYTKIYSTEYAFAALKADGSITAWGASYAGGTSAPSGSDYTKIYSTDGAFAALKADGSIKAWGDSNYGGTGAPSGNNYIKIYSTLSTFAALKADGSIKAWGSSGSGGTGAPSDSGYTKIYSTDGAFAALKADGSITVWGASYARGTSAPSGSGYTKIYSTKYAFAALKADGTITAWGHSLYGGTGAPAGSGYTKIYSTMFAFAAFKADGTITAWGTSSAEGTTLAPNLANAAGVNQLAIIGSAIKNITFSNSGGAIASCAVAPALPTGLSIDSATCTISGTPTELRTSTLYTVTATNTIGQSAIATVDLEILLADSVPATLTAVATGAPNEITLSWARVTGATAYRVYQTTDITFAKAGNSDPSQFSAYSPAATSTDTTATSITITLSGAATVYYVVTAINGNVESFSNPIPAAATAHAFKFGQVTSSTGQVWMDRNLGASQVATSSTDPASYGDLYQWGRPADGHQIRTSAITATLATNTTPGHADFITTTDSQSFYDWMLPNIDDDGALRSAFLAKTDGSGVCPTGFNVPTEAQLKAEIDIWGTTNYADISAFNSVLKLPVAGARIRRTGRLGNVGYVGYYWTRSVVPTNRWYRYARYLGFGDYSVHAEFANVERSASRSIRCIKN